MNRAYLDAQHPFYLVIVDTQVVDSFESTKRLTWSEQRDIANGYLEAYDGEEWIRRD